MFLLAKLSSLCLFLAVMNVSVVTFMVQAVIIINMRKIDPGLLALFPVATISLSSLLSIQATKFAYMKYKNTDITVARKVLTNTRVLVKIAITIAIAVIAAYVASFDFVAKKPAIFLGCIGIALASLMHMLSLALDPKSAEHRRTP